MSAPAMKLSGWGDRVGEVEGLVKLVGVDRLAWVVALIGWSVGRSVGWSGGRVTGRRGGGLVRWRVSEVAVWSYLGRYEHGGLDVVVLFDVINPKLLSLVTHLRADRGGGRWRWRRRLVVVSGWWLVVMGGDGWW